MSYSPEVSSIFGSPSSSSSFLSSSSDVHHAEPSHRRRRSPSSSSESGSDTDSSLGDLPLINRPRNYSDIPSSPPAEPRNGNYIAAVNRRRNLDETLNVRRGDQRGLSQILQDRRRGQPDGNVDAGSGGSSASQQPAERPSGRRNTIVEVDDDSDDDIVFTGENRNPNPPPPPNLRHIPRQAQHPRAYGAIRQRLNGNANADAQDRIFRAPSPGRFRRMMDEIDELLDRRGEAHDAIINDQEDERRRQILSPPVAVPIPPRRIGLGGGGLFRRTAPPQAQNPADELNNDAVPGWLPPLGQVFRFANGRGDPDMAEMEMRIQLGGLAGGMFGGGIRHQQQQEDIQTILSKIAPPPYPKTMITKGFTNDFDMDSIVRNEPIELDDDGNIIKSNTIKKKERLVCSDCRLPLLVSSAYKSPNDKLWVLRCGHLLDEYCLNSLQTPQTPLEISSIVRHETNDGTPEKKRRRKNASRRVKKPDPPKPDEYTFRCPVTACGKEHKSVHFVDDEEGRWKAKDGEGALPAYA